MLAWKTVIHRPRCQLTEPVSQQEGRLLGEVAIIKDQDELGAVGTKALQRVGNTAGEIPQVALVHRRDVVAPVLVHRRDLCRAL